MTLNTEL
jgi:hypothetical protein